MFPSLIDALRPSEDENRRGVLGMVPSGSRKKSGPAYSSTSTPERTWNEKKSEDEQEPITPTTDEDGGAGKVLVGFAIAGAAAYGLYRLVSWVGNEIMRELESMPSSEGVRLHPATIEDAEDELSVAGDDERDRDEFADAKEQVDVEDHPGETSIPRVMERVITPAPIVQPPVHLIVPDELSASDDPPSDWEML